ncbi:MAG: imidazole glycerol phosphate synthase subunit HisH [Candidatus Lokiarchaeota archaeon]|nr:imidazole glycerol phosphate synthase subunit HisH [Candidatus Lokiarchaeota archaeon]
MTLLHVIDYGMGNLLSISKGLEKMGATVKIINYKDPEFSNKIKESAGLVIPGVGAFRDAMRNLHSIKNIIISEVENGKLLLGICLGFQLLFSDSTEGIENGQKPYKGLELIQGHVIRFPNDIVVPHMGWNSIKFMRESPLIQNIPENSYFYFVHSYYGTTLSENVIGLTQYEKIFFASIVQKDGIFATQFHPEKSSDLGLMMLQNFISLCKK